MFGYLAPQMKTGFWKFPWLFGVCRGKKLSLMPNPNSGRSDLDPGIEPTELRHRIQYDNLFFLIYNHVLKWRSFDGCIVIAFFVDVASARWQVQRGQLSYHRWPSVRAGDRRASAGAALPRCPAP